MTALTLHQGHDGGALALCVSRGQGPIEFVALVCDWRAELFRQAFARKVQYGGGRSIDELLADRSPTGVVVTVGRGVSRFADALSRWPLWLHAVEDAEGYLNGPPGAGAIPLLTTDALLAVHDLVGILENATGGTSGREVIAAFGEETGGVLHRRAKGFSGVGDLVAGLASPTPVSFGITTSALLVLHGRARHATVAEIQSLCEAITKATDPLDGVQTVVPATSRTSLVGAPGQYGASLYLTCGTALPGWNLVLRSTDTDRSAIRARVRA